MSCEPMLLLRDCSGARSAWCHNHKPSPCDKRMQENRGRIQIRLTSFVTRKRLIPSSLPLVVHVSLRSSYSFENPQGSVYT